MSNRLYARMDENVLNGSIWRRVRPYRGGREVLRVLGVTASGGRVMVERLDANARMTPPGMVKAFNLSWLREGYERVDIE